MTTLHQEPPSGGYLIKDADESLVQLYVTGLLSFLNKQSHLKKVTLLNPSDYVLNLYKDYGNLQVRWCNEANMLHFKKIIDSEYTNRHCSIT